MEIRALQPGDDRSRFRSGNVDLDRFFHRFAGQNQFRHHVGVTYVALGDGRILGFATVVASQIEVEGLPTSVKRSFPRYPLPVLRLAHLAVDGSAQGRGVGQALLRFVLHLALKMAETIGCVGIVVDAKEEATAFYEKYGFEPFSVIEGAHGSRPPSQLMFLSIDEVPRPKQQG
jgi:GNAT superfamily N-acetyltransferase